jgi:hypothetical protein
VTDPSPRQFLIDSNIFDRIADDPAAGDLVRSRVAEGVVELLVTHVQEDEIAAIPDEQRRRRLGNAVPRRVVPTHGAIWDVSKWGAARWTGEAVAADLKAIGRRNAAKDALIATTALWDEATLVTEDADLAEDASARGAVVMGWATFEAWLRAA